MRSKDISIEELEYLIGFKYKNPTGFVWTNRGVQIQYEEPVDISNIQDIIEENNQFRQAVFEMNGGLQYSHEVIGGLVDYIAELAINIPTEEEGDDGKTL